MGTRREDETTRLLRAASNEYDGLPTDVADRLDRVLEQLPAAHTLRLRAAETRPSPGWRERLRTRRLQYTLVSAAAALLVTIGAVATAVQVVSSSSEKGDTAVIAEDPAAPLDQGEPEQGGAGAPESTQEDELAAEGGPEEQEEGTEGVDESGNVEVFASGTDYGEGSDVLTALRELGEESTDGPVPPELSGLAEGGALWNACQEAIAREYDSLIVAADFARFETEPAVVALLVSDSGELAVALTPDCGNGQVVELFVQE